MDMIKYGMGKFKGIPVYKVSWEHWHNTNIDTKALEEIFVVQDEVFYHDVRIAYLNSSRQLEDFNEEKFEELRNRYNKKEIASNEEVCAEAPSESVETDHETLVDKDRRNWQIFVDSEMAKLKAEIAKMEAELNAVG